MSDQNLQVTGPETNSLLQARLDDCGGDLEDSDDDCTDSFPDLIETLGLAEIFAKGSGGVIVFDMRQPVAVAERPLRNSSEPHPSSSDQPLPN